jgi:hypothetical protein
MGVSVIMFIGFPKPAASPFSLVRGNAYLWLAESAGNSIGLYAGLWWASPDDQRAMVFVSSYSMCSTSTWTLAFAYVFMAIAAVIGLKI